MSDDSPARYERDGKTYYRASSLGMCDRMFVALATGYTPKAHPEWFQAVLDEGTAMESEIDAMWTEQTGSETINAQARIEWEVMDNVFIVGHIDGQAINRTNNITALREYKKARDSTWSHAQRAGVEMMPTYPYQTAAYMIGGEFAMMEFVIGHFDVEAGRITEVAPFTYHDPPVPRKAILKRIGALEGMVSDGLHPMDVPCNTRMFPCPFYYLHDADNLTEPPERPADDTIRELVSQHEATAPRVSELRKELKELEARAAALKEGVKAWLLASGNEGDCECVVDVDGQKYTIKWAETARAGYTVEPGVIARVTVKAVKDKDSARGSAPAPARARVKTAANQ